MFPIVFLIISTGAIAAYARGRGVGMGRRKPSGMWSGPNCSYLNQHYAVLCEACSRPYARKS